MSQPKILLWDIETAHNLTATFRLFEDFTPPENILRERYIICAAWKWLGEKKVHAVSVLDDPKLYAKDPHNDLHVLKELHKALSEADVIVAHNGDKFDIKFTEGRMLIQGLPPLPPINKIDTYKVTKKRFLFNSNKLDYLGKILGVGRKISTTNSLWLKVLNGDKAAIEKMVAYNKEDVRLLERVFKKLQPYMATHPVVGSGKANACPKCGSKKVQKRGYARNATRSYQRFQCMGCGGWHRALKAEKSEQEVRSI